MIKLIEKLFNINIDWKMIKLISSFLQDRKMRVQIKLSFSDWVAVLSGVPQGSVMGFLLFLIFINDLPLWIRNSRLLMFADDTKISRKVSKVEDGFLLQQDLDCLMEWSKYWRLDFNIDKCTIMRIQQCCHDKFKLNGNKLQEVTKEKDLGIIVTKDLKPSVQMPADRKC